MKQKRVLRRGWLRKFAALTALVTAVAGLNLVGPQEAQAANSPYVPARYRLVWSDEFEGNSLNASNWTPATGAWGDNMQMVYKDQPRNLYVKDGSLHLVAYYEKGGVKTNVCGGQKVKTGKNCIQTRRYTSAMLRSRAKQHFKYGYYEAPIKLPKGHSSWSSFWLLAQDKTYGDWPHSGEIDVFESKGYDPQFVQSTAHWFNKDKGKRDQSNNWNKKHFGINTQDGYHTYGLLWEPNKLTYYIDGVKTHEIKSPLRGTHSNGFMPFDKEFYLLLNHGVGGNFLEGHYNPAGGYIERQYVNGQDMSVDYVRVYQKK